MQSYNANVINRGVRRLLKSSSGKKATKYFKTYKSKAKTMDLTRLEEFKKALTEKALKEASAKIDRDELISMATIRSTGTMSVSTGYTVKTEAPDPSSEIGRLITEAKEKSVKEDELNKEKRLQLQSSFPKSKFETLGGYFQVENGIYQILKRNILKGVSTMLLGPTGIGKTEVIWNIAKELGKDITVFDMGTMSDPVMSLIGTHTMQIRDGKTFSSFIPSRFSEVIQKPGVVLLDEISRSSPSANNLLFPCLDFRRELPMEYSFGHSDPIKIHPECVFMSTANIGSQYSGTHKIDRALMDRFMPIEVPELPRNETKIALASVCKSLNEAQIKLITDIYFHINEKHKTYVVPFSLSFRHLKIIGKMVEDGFTIYDSFIVLARGLSSVDGDKAITEILNIYKNGG